MPRPKINNNIPSYIEELIEEVKNLRGKSKLVHKLSKSIIF